MSECVAENGHRRCLLCGDLHPNSFGLRFTPHDDDGVRAVFQGYDELQGYDGILHGGVIASLLDSAMTNCLFQQGVQALTADLKIRYKYSIPCCAKLDLQARLIESRDPLYRLKADLILDGRCMARGEARFMRINRMLAGSLETNEEIVRHIAESELKQIGELP